MAKLLGQFGVVAACAFLGTLTYAACKVAPGPSEPALQADNMMEALAPSAIAALGMVALLYAFLFIQSSSIWGGFARAKADAERDNKPKPRLYDLKYGHTKYTRRADRTVANMLEQMPCALVSTTLYALFVNAELGPRLGWVWILFRSIYPVVYGRGALLFCSTLPGYAIVCFCAVSVTLQVI